MKTLYVNFSGSRLFGGLRTPTEETPASLTGTLRSLALSQALMAPGSQQPPCSIEPKLPQRRLKLLDLLRRKTTLRVHIDLDLDGQGAGGGVLRQHLGIEIHPFLMRDWSRPVDALVGARPFRLPMPHRILRACGSVVLTSFPTPSWPPSWGRRRRPGQPARRSPQTLPGNCACSPMAPRRVVPRCPSRPARVRRATAPL